MVFLYKLMCALVLVAVSFDSLLAPAYVWLSRAVRGRRHWHWRGHASDHHGAEHGTTETGPAKTPEPTH
jgi:hypothetical protein